MAEEASEAPVADSNALVELRDVRKTYQSGSLTVEAVRGISLEVQSGDYVAIMGPSGSGKSTLMHLIGCLDVPTSGTLAIGGDYVGTLSDDELAELRSKRIGFVFQQFNLLGPLSALRNVELPLLYTSGSRSERLRRAEEMLTRVGLSSHIRHRPNELSGGQQQRVAIARALINEPDLILADEPTGNLDSQSSQEILDLFDEFHQLGRSIVVITHDLEVAERASRVIRIRDGMLVEAA